MATINNKKPLHPRNPHNQRYDFPLLIKSYPLLKPFVSLNQYDDLSVDFSNPDAVLALNKALLAHFYGIKNYDIPKDYLCPPIPGRADYIHYLADLLAGANEGKVPVGDKVRGLDIGVGANGIYPIIGNRAYGWSFVGSDISTVAIDSLNDLIEKNSSLQGAIEGVVQTNSKDIFTGIINEKDQFDFVVCNPPFHKSKQEATQGTQRKVKNLTYNVVKNPTLNFGGVSNELWCDGGEVAFIKKMIAQSLVYSHNCFWFTTLVSKKENLHEIYKNLKSFKPVVLKTIEMKQGQKISRIVAWTFLTKSQQKTWRRKRWQNSDK